MSKTMRATLVWALHTRAPHATYTCILFQDGESAIGVGIEVEAGKDDTCQT